MHSYMTPTTVSIYTKSSWYNGDILGSKYMYKGPFKLKISHIIKVSLNICYVFILSQPSIPMTELEPVQTP